VAEHWKELALAGTVVGLTGHTAASCDPKERSKTGQITNSELNREAEVRIRTMRLLSKLQQEIDDGERR
jgi:hypothetical protein